VLSYKFIYRVIRKSLRDFPPLRYSPRDGHARRGVCHQRERHSKFLFYLTGARYVHPWWRGRCQLSSCHTHAMRVCGRNLITGLTSAASPRVDISSTCKVEQKLEVSLPLLTCSPSAWPSRLLHRGGRKSRRDLWITLYKSTQLDTPEEWADHQHWCQNVEYRIVNGFSKILSNSRQCSQHISIYLQHG
jgi:hypothetical protein